jgi:hypothetical protein
MIAGDIGSDRQALKPAATRGSMGSGGRLRRVERSRHVAFGIETDRLMMMTAGGNP